MALLLQKRRELLASPMAADIIMNLFVLEQMCLVSVTNVLLSDLIAPAGCRPAGRAQAGKSSCTPYVLRRKFMCKDVQSHSGQKISCTSINRHVLRIYEDILYLKNSY